MPEIIVSLTATEYGQSQKKLKRKQFVQSITLILISTTTFLILYFIGWQVIHIGD